MAKVTIPANELTEATATFVSLVKRGANRVPFRMQKKDTTMIDLAKLFRVRKADPVPAVLTAIVRKGANLDVAMDRLVKSGLSVEHMSETDEATLFAQPDVKEEGSTFVLKLDEDAALVITGLAKAISDYEFQATTFDEVLAIEGFRPSLYLGMDILRGTIGNILSEAESSSDAADKLSKAIDQYKSYTVSLAQALPVKAFKADIAKGEPAPALPAATAEERLAASEAEGTKAGEPETVAKAEQAPAPEAPAAQAFDTAALLQQVQAIVEAAVGTATQTLKGELDSVRGDVQAVTDRVAKAETALSGTIGGAAPTDTRITRKADAPVVLPLIDTAFMKVG